MRDHTRLKVFGLADRLAVSIYRESASFPADERYGLQSQVRRAAVSIAANIVEGCARTTAAEYMRFIEIAYASARELQYEIGLCGRLGYIPALAAKQLHRDCTETAKALNGLLRSLRDN
jgi:four helix bundle protein